MSRAELPGTQAQASNYTALGNVESQGRTANSGTEWFPTMVRYYDPGSKPLAEQLAESTPSNAELVQWASRPKNQPPQSWWDDTSDPFDLPPE